MKNEKQSNKQNYTAIYVLKDGYPKTMTIKNVNSIFDAIERFKLFMAYNKVDVDDAMSISSFTIAPVPKKGRKPKNA